MRCCALSQADTFEISIGFGAAHPFGFHLTLVGSRGVRRLGYFGQARALSGPDPTTEGWTSRTDDSLDDSGAQALTVMLARHVVDIALGEVESVSDIELLLKATLTVIVAARSAVAGGDHLPVPDHRTWL